MYKICNKKRHRLVLVHFDVSCSKSMSVWQNIGLKVWAGLSCIVYCFNNLCLPNRLPRCLLHVHQNEAARLELRLSYLYIYRTQPGHKKENYRPTKRSHTLLFPPLALITAQICCGTSLSSCKFTRFISVQCCVHFSFLTRMLYEGGRARPLHKAPQQGEVLDSVVANPYGKMIPHAPSTTAS